MKLLTFSILFLTSAAGMLFAHPGHGAIESGLGHYLSSALHVAPAIIGALALMIFAVKRAKQSN